MADRPAPAPKLRPAMTGPRWFADVGLVAELTEQGWQYVIPGLEGERRINLDRIRPHPPEHA